MKTISVFVPLTIVMLLTPQWAAAGKLYKWVDENGNVTYQDSPPPEGSEYSERSVEGVAGAGEPEELDPAEQLAAATERSPILMYSISDCDGCELYRSFFQRHGIPFREKDVEDNIATQTELKARAGRLEVPIVLVGEKVLRGYNRALLENVLETAGFPPLAGIQPAAGGEQGALDEDQATETEESEDRNQDEDTTESGELDEDQTEPSEAATEGGETGS